MKKKQHLCVYSLCLMLLASISGCANSDHDNKTYLGHSVIPVSMQNVPMNVQHALRAHIGEVIPEKVAISTNRDGELDAYYFWLEQRAIVIQVPGLELTEYVN